MKDDIDHRIAYYSRGEAGYNFGDYLTEYFYRHLLIEPFVEANVYRLIGSVISTELMEWDLAGARHDARLSYWCCGTRGVHELPTDLKSRCDFWGVRGPLTRDALGLDADMVLGDPGFLLPLLYQPERRPELCGKTGCMPHYSAVHRAEDLRASVGADFVLSPSVCTDEDLESLIDQIASMDFLLTASLHGAILACAYGVPFAFWDYGEIDVPFKWDDTCALMGIDCVFHTDIESAKSWWEAQSAKLKLPALLPMLKACPFTVRPAYLQRAAAHDAANGYDADADAPLTGFDRPDWIEKIRANNEVARKAARIDAVKASRIATDELDMVRDLLAGVSRHIGQRQSLRSVDFKTTSSLTFGQDRLGNCLLGQGWSHLGEPMPWSLYPFAAITLPAASGWQDARSLRLSGHLFVPKQAGQGSRRVRGYINEAMVLEQTFENTGDKMAIQIDLDLPVPSHVSRESDGVLRIYASETPLPCDVSSSSDTRPLLLAATALTAVFD